MLCLHIHKSISQCILFSWFYAPAAVPTVIGVLWGEGGMCVAPPYFLIDCNIFSIVSGATGYVS